MIESISAGIIATIVCSISIKLWEKFKNRNKQDDQIANNKVNLKYIKLVRMQFFICFTFLFIVTIGLFFNWFTHDFLLTFIFVTIFFVFLIIWGAFDAVFYPLKEVLRNNKNEPTNKNTNSDK